MQAQTALVSASTVTGRRALAVALGAALVAIAAQIAIPLPGTPVPMTLQPLAVLLVGGWLGARLGAGSLIFYLALGAAGLPVFTPYGLPGVARLLGPTGGYLLAYPVAAFAVGRLVGATDPGRKPGVARLSLAVFTGLVLIHLGGLAQLRILTGSAPGALACSSLPWAAGFALATWLVGRVLERRSWEELGWSPRASLPLALLGGIALGAAMAACAVGLAVIAGRAAITVTADGSGWRAAALPLGVGFLVAALAEELAFRGYPLRRLAAATGPLPATALTALGFGLLHLGNPGATVFSTANVALAGVWLAAALFSPGAMPLGWGAHFG